jgi:hypothetical protein
MCIFKTDFVSAVILTVSAIRKPPNQIIVSPLKNIGTEFRFDGWTLLLMKKHFTFCVPVMPKGENLSPG